MLVKLPSFHLLVVGVKLIYILASFRLASPAGIFRGARISSLPTAMKIRIPQRFKSKTITLNEKRFVLCTLFGIVTERQGMKFLNATLI